MKRTTLLFVLFISGCVTPLDVNNCTVRAVHIEGDVSVIGIAESEYDGTQVTVINMAACPGLDLVMPAPRDSSKNITVNVPGKED